MAKRDLWMQMGEDFYRSLSEGIIWITSDERAGCWGYSVDFTINGHEGNIGFDERLDGAKRMGDNFHDADANGKNPLGIDAFKESKEQTWWAPAGWDHGKINDFETPFPYGGNVEPWENHENGSELYYYAPFC